MVESNLLCTIAYNGMFFSFVKLFFSIGWNKKRCKLVCGGVKDRKSVSFIESVTQLEKYASGNVCKLLNNSSSKSTTFSRPQIPSISIIFSIFFFFTFHALFNVHIHLVFNKIVIFLFVDNVWTVAMFNWAFNIKMQ